MANVYVYNLNDWVLDKSVKNSIRFIEIRLHLKHLDFEELLNFKPKERIRIKNEYLKNNFDRLIKTNYFNDYKIIGTNRKPTGIEVKIPYIVLNKLKKLEYINNIFIQSVTDASKKIFKKEAQYYTVKRTIVIQIEGKYKGYQTIEERFVLVKANSFEDAYTKVKKGMKAYNKPYLNSNGELVRWQVESYEDCFELFDFDFSDVNKNEGIEVFSKLKKRRFTKENFWDGKLD